MLHYAYRGVQRAVRDERYKLIEYVVNGERTTQLFDLQEDPWELRDLSRRPYYYARLAALRDELRRWQTEMDDDQPGQGADFWSGFED